MNFNSSVGKLYTFASGELRKKLGLETTEIAGLGPVIPSKKPSGRHKVDTYVFDRTKDLVNTFEMNTCTDTVTLAHLKCHAIQMGSVRSDYYKQRRILFQDQNYVELDESLDSSLDSTVDSL